MILHLIIAFLAGTWFGLFIGCCCSINHDLSEMEEEDDS